MSSELVRSTIDANDEVSASMNHILAFTLGLLCIIPDFVVIAIYDGLSDAG